MPQERHHIFRRAEHGESLSEMGRLGGLKSGQIRRTQSFVRKADQESVAEPPVQPRHGLENGLEQIKLFPENCNGDANDTKKRRWRRKGGRK